jgi:glycosyltransferase involved in cell wall biosynthesis
MRLGINAQLLAAGSGYRRAGVSRYLEQLLLALPGAIADADDLLVWAARGVPSPSSTLAASWHRTRVPANHPMLRIAWEQTLLPIHARRARIDLLHGPVNVAPLLAGCPTVVTVHDLAFLRVPAGLTSRRRHYLTAVTRVSVQRARRVIAVSASTKRDVVELIGVPPERVTVIPLAADERFRPLDAGDLARFRAEHGLRRPFVLYVGTLEPRKNVPALLRAFATIASEVPHELILVGAEGWLTGEIHATLATLRLGDRVRLTGYGDPATLPGWYGAADLFVYPSRFEGFGLPPLEAMACGTPVIVSNAASLPEVGGDAVLTVDPDDIDGLAAAMHRMLTDPALAAGLRARGLARAATFSWERTARETVRVYREALA